MPLTNESPIGDIIARFKELTGSTSEDKSLAKRGKAKLLAAIEHAEAVEKQADLDHAGQPGEAEATATTETEVEPAAEPEPKAEEPKAEAKPAKAAKPKREKKPKKEKKPPRPVIRAEAEKLLLKVVSVDEDKRQYGLPYEDILTKLREQFDGCKTSVACLRWYAVHMRERGEKVPARPRAAPAKGQTESSAEAA